MANLWSKRFKTFLQERIFILRRIVNGFSFLPLLMFLFGLYYYPMFIEWLPQSKLVPVGMALIITWIVSKGKFRSFLEEADIVYLTPNETGLGSYFSKCLFYNITLQGFFVFCVSIVLSPLYLARISEQKINFVIFVLLLLLLKTINVVYYWLMLKAERGTMLLPRFLVNFVLITGFLLHKTYFVFAGILLIIGLGLLILLYKKRARIHWFRLLENDQQLDSQFVHWIGYFIEQQRSIGKEKQRTYLDITYFFSKTHQNSFAYLFFKVLIRTELVGIIIRIALIGFALLWFITNLYIEITTFVFLLFIVGLQMNTFWNMLQQRFWMKLYPLTLKYEKKSFLSSSFIVMFIVSIWLAIPLIVHHVSWAKILILVSFIVGTPVLYIYLYLARKIRIAA